MPVVDTALRSLSPQYLLHGLCNLLSRRDNDSRNGRGLEAGVSHCVRSRYGIAGLNERHHVECRQDSSAVGFSWSRFRGLSARTGER
jgi:hypothetical protein